MHLHNTYVNVIVAHKAVTNVNLDEMIAESTKDTNSDDDSSEGNDDPALLVCVIFDYIIF